MIDDQTGTEYTEKDGGLSGEAFRWKSFSRSFHWKPFTESLSLEGSASQQSHFDLKAVLWLTAAHSLVNSPQMQSCNSTTKCSLSEVPNAQRNSKVRQALQIGGLNLFGMIRNELFNIKTKYQN